MKKWFKIIGLLGFLFLFFWTFWFLYQKSKTKPIVYKTEKASIRDIVRKTVATGSVIPRNEIEIKPQVSGIIEALYTEPGKLVRKGDPIAKIRIIPNMLNLSSAENRLNRAGISLDNAEMEFKRNQVLYQKGVISLSEFQRFELNLKNAKEEKSAALENLQIIKDGISSSKESGNTLIRSTVNGMVLDVPVEIGNSVIETNNFNAGTTIAFIADMNEMIFEGNVDESEVGKLKPGMELILNIGAIDKQTFKATLEYIAPKGIEDQGAIKFMIRAAVVTDQDVFLRAGYSANADIVLEKKNRVVSIPESLVVYEEGKTFVEIEKKAQNFEKIPVKLGLSDGIYTEVVSGIDTTYRIKGGELIEETEEGKSEGPKRKFGS